MIPLQFSNWWRNKTFTNNIPIYVCVQTKHIQIIVSYIYSNRTKDVVTGILWLFTGHAILYLKIIICMYHPIITQIIAHILALVTKNVKELLYWMKYICINFPPQVKIKRESHTSIDGIVELRLSVKRIIT